MSNLKLALLSTVCLVPLLTLSANPALAAKAGVTAAVNPQAVGTAPGSGVRTIVLGEDVVTNEKIDTTGGGLVQILLADGTTFTVGPNSSLTIDKFVYDPDANTAQVTASLAKGVFRFIGGRTSKTDGGVTINTPVGTVGIRGAVADISLTPNGQTLKAQIDLLFGKEVTLSGPGGLIDRIFKAGYSIVIGADGHAQLVKTPPGSANVIQTALAGKPGTHGGAGNGPSDGDVKDSDVPKGNSDNHNPPGYTPPDLEAIELATIDFFNGHDDAKDLLDNQNEEQPGPISFWAGMVINYVTWEQCDGSYEASDGDFHPLVSDASDTLINLVDDDGLSVSGAHVKVKGDGQADDGIDGVEITTGDVEGGPSASVHTADGEFPSLYPATTHVNLSNTPLCIDCSFLHWGTWDTNFLADINNGNVGAAGTWVSGDFPGAAAFNNYSNDHVGETATYSGTAVGYASDNNSSARYATGDLSMSWDFGSRRGQLLIEDFDDHFDPSLNDGDGGNVSYSFNAAVDGSGGRFSGSNVDTGDGITKKLGVTGAFASDGSNVAAGVMGNFSASHTDINGGTWSAAGIFGGSRETQ